MAKKKKEEALEGKEKVFAFRWDTEIISRWEDIAAKLHRNEPPSSAARELLQEYISCFLTDDELEQLGFMCYGTYPPPRLAHALRKAKQMRKGSAENL